MRIVNEKSVALLWKSGRLTSFRDDLGNDVEVICHGRDGTKPGCDFQDAVISVNSEKVVGDVELHLTSDLWEKHGHQDDPAYNGVILHVVMWQKGELPVRLEKGSPLPTVILSRYVSADELSHWRARATPQCTQARCQSVSLRAAILRAGVERFNIKTSRFSAALQSGGPEQVLYKGICRALGYSRNIVPFETLAERLPIAEIYRLAGGSLPRKKALLLGCAGFLSGIRDIADMSAADLDLAGITATWGSMGVTPRRMSEADWCFSYVRPSNHLVRRLTYLAHLLHKHETEGLLGTLLRTIRGVSPGAEGRCMERVLAIVEVPFLIGSGRVRDIVINQVLPFLLAHGVRTGELELASRSLYIYLSYGALPDNELLRYMRSLLSIEARGLNACAQQGLLHIYHTFCRTKDCALCPVSSCRRPGRG